MRSDLHWYNWRIEQIFSDRPKPISRAHRNHQRTAGREISIYEDRRDDVTGAIDIEHVPASAPNAGSKISKVPST